MSGFEDLHDELRAVARDLLGKPEAPGWQALVDAGWPGLEVPEALGGAGATFAEVAVVLEEMGRAATAGPFLGTAVLGVGTLALLEPGDARDALLTAVAAGEARVAVAVTDGALDAAGGTPPFRLEPDGDRGALRLHGEAGFVPDADGADLLLLVAQGPDGAPVVVEATAAAELRADLAVGQPDPLEVRGTAPARGRPAVRVTPQPVLDATRALARVEAAGVEVGAEHVLRFASGVEGPAGVLADRAAVALACDSVGVAEAMVDATVAYAQVRQQFGRPIGSFQAVKHMCADMLVEVTLARELLAGAVRAVAAGGPPGEAAAAASMAKSQVGAMAVDVVGTALQLHGGIGYTWESGVHTYLKRAALNRSLFGSPRAHRRSLGARYAVAGTGPTV